METSPAAPKKGGLKTVLLAIVLGALALTAGLVLPALFLSARHAPEEKAKGGNEESKSAEAKKAYVPFGDVIVNLNEDRLTRYLRVKLLLVVDSTMEQQTIELVNKNKPVLKNWLIAYLSDKSLHEVSGAAGVNRLRREIWQEFNRELFPDGSEKIRDVYFEDLVVQ